MNFLMNIILIFQLFQDLNTQTQNSASLNFELSITHFKGMTTFMT